MSTIGNILWFLFGGLIGGLAWVLAGCLWCITIIGIPVGLQCAVSSASRECWSSAHNGYDPECAD